MKRIVLIAAVMLAGCGGEEDTWCTHPDASAVGTWTLTLDGECSGTVAVEEAARACGADLVGTWTCGDQSGEICGRSFRWEGYAEVYLCSGTPPNVITVAAFTGAVDALTGTPPGSLTR